MATYGAHRQQLAALVLDDEAIKAALVIGSRARDGADRAADLDVVLVVENPEAYLATQHWLGQLGRIWAYATDRTMPGAPIKRVLLDGAAAIDFIILGTGQEVDQAFLTRAADALRRGYVVLKDEVGITDQLALMADAAAEAHAHGERPTQEEFADLVAGFWIDAVRTAKLLARGEAAAAAALLGDGLRSRLVGMEAWAVRAVAGAPYDTFWEARHLEHWADKQFLQQFANTFAAYEVAALRQALYATMDLFRLLAVETSHRWGLDYPEAADMRATVWARTWQ
ncbi:MAG: aminoglycoside 6-adenylyltransferase [Bifidobacteriaceae bacterium]|jgi:aminoglycoside 6-adenylyltransferase|nr:aminoglycoside 6-adenylyltransferase [Bifidobacteriaceae bacterium]